MPGNSSGSSNLGDDDADKMTMMMTEKQSNFSIFSYAGEDDPMEDEVVRILIILLYGIVFVTCFSGNVLVVVVISLHRRMRTITNFFLANLAVTDLCVAVFCVLPNLSTYLSSYWILGRAMCKVYYFVQAVSYTASVCILVVISLERYVAIIHPIRSRQLQTMCLLRTTVTSVWTVAACSGIPYLVIYDTVSIRSTSPGSGQEVQFCLMIHDYNLEAYTFISFLLWYVVPLLVMTYVYCRISVVLWRSSHSTELSSSVGGRGGATAGGGGAGRGGGGGRVGEGGGTSASGGAAPSSAYSYAKMSHVGMMDLSKEATVKVLPSSSDQQGQNSHSLEEQDADSAESDSDGKWPSAAPVGRWSVSGCRGRAAKGGETTASKKAVSFRVPLEKAPGNALNSRRKVIRLLIAVVTSFAICVLPYHVRVLWQSFSADPQLSFWYRLIPPLTFVLYYLNSALNPILYAFLSDKFRSSFMDLTRCRRDRRASHAVSITMKTINSSV